MPTERKTGYNSTFAIGWVSCSADSLMVVENFVLRINFRAEKHAHRHQQNITSKHKGRHNNDRTD